jgi:hypothetical protein
VTPALLLFAVGGLLLVTGVLGGGFELREVKIPQVGRLARVLATGAGIFCILIGLSMAVEPAVAGRPRFQVRDQLADYQVYEVASIVIDGRALPDLTVTESARQMVVDGTVDAPGRHDYTITISTIETDDAGNQSQVESSGQGTIQIADGSSFALNATGYGPDRNVMLVEE